MGQYAQSMGDSPTYSGSVPDQAVAQIGIEGSQRFGPEFELGVFLTFLPVGTVNNTFQLPNPGNPSYPLIATDSYSITSELFGLQARYILSHGDFRPFISGGLALVAMQINFNSSDSFGNPDTLEYDTDTINGNFMGLGFGGQAQVGLDWDLGGGFVVSQSVGYQFASASNFQAPVTGTYSEGQTMTLTLDKVPTDFGTMIVPVSSGNVERPVYGRTTPNIYPGDPAPSTTPMTVDLSGLKGNLQVSYNF